MVAITYDAPELQRAFIEAGGITYPFLSDIDAATMIALGILNEEYSPGERAYGIPHPGVFVVNPQGEIVGKIFVDKGMIKKIPFSHRGTGDFSKELGPLKGDREGEKTL